jgi:hypothetical protein
MYYTLSMLFITLQASERHFMSSGHAYSVVVAMQTTKDAKESIEDRLLQTLRIELRTFCVLDRNHNR